RRNYRLALGRQLRRPCSVALPHSPSSRTWRFYTSTSDVPPHYRDSCSDFNRSFGPLNCRNFFLWPKKLNDKRRLRATEQGRRVDRAQGGRPRPLPTPEILFIKSFPMLTHAPFCAPPYFLTC